MDTGAASPGDDASAPLDTSAQRRATSTVDTPRAMVEEKVHNFGTFDLHQVGTHRFTVRNEGAGALRLQPIATSCKCIASEIERLRIPPGEAGDVVVYWKSGEVHEQFAQATSIKTNDPDLPVLQFKVMGRYLPVVAARPPQLYLPRVRPGESAIANALIVSQRWEDFTLSDFESSLEGVRWDLKPAAAAELEKLKAEAGYHVEITLPKDLPQGPFTHWVRFNAVSEKTDDTEPKKVRLEMPLTGKVLRRLAVYGKGIDANGTVRFGTVHPGAAHEQQFTIKVHDREPALKVTSIDAKPACLDVALAPYGDGTKEDLYSLRVTVPADAREGVYRGADAGWIVISFDHPRIREIELSVDLVVAPVGRFATN